MSRAINTLVVDEQIFSVNFDLDQADKAYNTAKAEWEKLLNKRFPEIEQCKDPLPSLLLKKNWEEDKKLIQIFVDKFRKKPTSILEGMNLLSLGATIITLLMFAFGLYLTAAHWPFREDLLVAARPYVWVNAIVFLLQSFFTGWFFLDVFWQLRHDRVKHLFPAIVTCLTIEIGTLSLLSLSSPK